MASFSCVFVFVLCVLAVEAFPNARRSGPDKAFVLYRMPSRCVDAPKNDICDLGYKIRYMGDQNFGDVVSASFGGLKSLYEGIGLSDPCVGHVMKLLCRNAFPECMPDARVDFGDQDEVLDEIEECGSSGVYIAQSFRQQNFNTGIHKDSLAHHFTFDCTHVPQDAEQKCPRPKYAIPKKQVKDYYERIQNTSRNMAEDKDDNIPDECYQKAFNTFGCSYAFCSSDKKALLMKTSEQDCLHIKDCLTKHNALDDEKEKFLDEVCAKYPSPEDYKQVDLPY